MVEAKLYKRLSEDKVQCRLCNHFCTLDNAQTGQCGVRTNRGGTLYTLVADRVAALSIDPVEKKPLFHFLPGSQTLSFATMGCNLACSFCQNHNLSQPPRGGAEPMGQQTSAEQLVESALRSKCQSISYTYSEPTIFFELMQGTATLACDQGLRNIMVSNGFMSPQCLDELGPSIHAANIDLKSFSDDFYRERCGARLTPVLDNLRRIVELGWWLEVTTLIIPGLNDSKAELEDIAGFIATELGPQVPWHISRFHPDYELTNVGATPVSTLERAWSAGRAAGLHFVYTGNVPGHDRESTFCPGCEQKLVSRKGFRVLSIPKAPQTCPTCGSSIAGVWS